MPGFVARGGLCVELTVTCETHRENCQPTDRLRVGSSVKVPSFRARAAARLSRASSTRPTSTWHRPASCTPETRLTFRQSVVSGVRVVAQRKPSTNRRRSTAAIVRGCGGLLRKKAHRAQQQSWRRAPSAVRLHEGAQLAVESRSHLVVNRLADLAPAIDRASQLDVQSRGRRDRRHPGHDLR